MPRLRLLALAALLSPATLAAQGRTERGAFVVRLGSDTLAVERYSRSGTRFESDIAARIPRTRRMHYTGTLNPDGTMKEIRITGTPVSQGPGQLPPLDATLVFGKDSARSTLKLGDSTIVAAAAVQPGVMPVTTFSYALYELIALRALQSKADSVGVQVLARRQPDVRHYAVRRARCDGHRLLRLADAPQDRSRRTRAQRGRERDDQQGDGGAGDHGGCGQGGAGLRRAGRRGPGGGPALRAGS